MRAVAFAALLAGCASAAPSIRAAPPIRAVETGLATFYSDSLAGQHTASGVPYRPDALTAAHRTLPLGTLVRVTRTDTAASVEVEVNDRGPYGSTRRIIDLSRAAATRLEMLDMGLAPVRVEVLTLGHGRHRRHGHTAVVAVE